VGPFLVRRALSGSHEFDAGASEPRDECSAARGIEGDGDSVEGRGPSHPLPGIVNPISGGRPGDRGYGVGLPLFGPCSDTGFAQKLVSGAAKGMVLGERAQQQ